MLIFVFMNTTISIFLDTRRELKSGLYPVKLRVYSNELRKAKLYKTKFEYSKEEFKSIWETTKPRKVHQTDRLELEGVLNNTRKKTKGIKPFSFEQYEKKLYLKAGEGENVFYQYQQMINRNTRSGSVGNADVYRLSMKSIKDYLKETTGKEPTKLRFIEITPRWLADYENYQLKVRKQKRSRTTVSMYLRTLRAVFNEAIKENEIPSEVYPFGKNKYKIPKVSNVKKALNREQLKRLFEAKPLTPEQKKAKDFWFFSYATSGMNIKDIALLRDKDLQGDTLVYYRAKTINTSDEAKPIRVYLNDFTRSVIENYRNDKKGVLFPIITDSMSEVEKQKAVKNFTRFINQNLKKLAKSVGLPEDISTYWARHSFATNAIRGGASMEFVSEALNHSDMNTTKKYFAGFEEETKRELSNNLMDF